MTNCTYSAKLNIHHLSQCLTRYFRLIKNPHRILMDLWGWKIIPISTRCPSHMDPRPAFLRYANGHTDTLVVMYSIKYAPLPGAIKCSSKCSGFRTRCRLCVWLAGDCSHNGVNYEPGDKVTINCNNWSVTAAHDDDTSLVSLALHTLHNSRTTVIQ